MCTYIIILITYLTVYNLYVYGVEFLFLYFIFNQLYSYVYYLLTDIFPLENMVQVEFSISPGVKHGDTINDDDV